MDRWQEEQRTHFSLTNLDRLIDQLANEVRGINAIPEMGLQPRGGSYQSEVDLMKSWVQPCGLHRSQLVHLRASAGRPGGAPAGSGDGDITVHYPERIRSARARGISPAMVYGPSCLRPRQVVARAPQTTANRRPAVTPGPDRCTVLAEP